MKTFAIVWIALISAVAVRAGDGPGTYFNPADGNAVSAVPGVTNAVVRRTVAFLGGSITEMNGFRPRVMRLLREKYPAVDFVEIAAGLSSTCSDTGAFRMEEDLLSKGVPDLFIVESAVNDDQDGHFDYLHCVRGLEGAVRHVLTINPVCAVVVGLMVNRHQYEQISRGEEPVPYAAGKAVAARYGAGLADVGGALVASSRRPGGMTWDVYRDCHPSPEGCDFGAREVLSAIDSVYDPLRNPKARPLPQPLDPLCYCRGKAFPFSAVKRGSGWELSQPDWTSVPGDKRKYFTRGEILWCETPGAEVSFKFCGTALGAFLTAGPDAGALEVSVDGEPFRRVELRADYGNLHYPYTQMLADELSDGEHAVRLRVASTVRNGKEVSAVRIHRLFVNEERQ